VRAVVVLALLALAACGADGPPEPVENAVRVDASTTVGVTAAF